MSPEDRELARENERLRRENRILKEERDKLKKVRPVSAIGPSDNGECGVFPIGRLYQVMNVSARGLRAFRRRYCSVGLTRPDWGHGPLELRHRRVDRNPLETLFFHSTGGEETRPVASEEIPVDKCCQLHQFMTHVDDLDQAYAKQIVLLWPLRLRLHHPPQNCKV